MPFFYQTLLTIILFLTLSFGLRAEYVDHKKKATTFQISKEIKPILRQEMQQLQQGMQDLIPAIISGDKEKIITIAQKMQHSYILKQKLTKEQKQDLHKNLPPTFIQLDQNFHRLAGMLAHTAKKEKRELVNFYFYKLTEACVQCHAKYAQQKFPKLMATPSTQTQTHQH